MVSTGLLVAAVVASAASARAGCQILVVGSDSQCAGGNGTRVTDAASHLTTLGYTVTTAAALPGSLAPYNVVWDPRCGTPLSAGDMGQYQTFLTAGGGLFLQSEYPGPDGGRNASIVNLFNNYLCAGTVSIGNTTASPGGSPTQLLNAGAPGGIVTTPNNLTGAPITPAGAGQFTGYGTGMQLLSLDSGGIWHCSAVCGGIGRVVIILDSNWLDLGGGYDTTNNRNLAHNIADYLCNPCFPGSPTATFTAGPSGTATSSRTETRTATESATRTASRTGTASATPTSSATATSSATPTETRTGTETRTETSTYSLTETRTETPTKIATDTRTDTRTRTGTASATLTASHTSSRTVTPSSTSTPSSTLSRTPTGTETGTPPPTTTPTVTPLPVATPTAPPPFFRIEPNVVPPGGVVSISWLSSNGGRLTITVWNSAGEFVAKVHDADIVPGVVHRVEWDLRNFRGDPVSSNVYVIRALGPVNAPVAKVAVGR